MNKEKWIKEIIGKTVEQYGFVYVGRHVDGYIEGYSYKRTNGELRHYISVSNSSFNELRMSLSTNAYGQMVVSATELVKPKFYVNIRDFIEYKSEEEFKQILRYFRDTLIQKGFAVLEEKSKPTTEIRPKKETSWKLFTEHEDLNREYRKKYHLEETESTRKLMQKISDIILETKDQEFSEVEEMLVGLAAVFADQLIRKRGGIWEWNESFHSCKIGGMKQGVYKIGSCIPLASMIFYWKGRKENVDTLLNEFKEFRYEEIN